MGCERKRVESWTCLLSCLLSCAAKAVVPNVHLSDGLVDILVVKKEGGGHLQLIKASYKQFLATGNSDEVVLQTFPRALWLFAAPSPCYWTRETRQRPSVVLLESVCYLDPNVVCLCHLCFSYPVCPWWALGFAADALFDAQGHGSEAHPQGQLRQDQCRRRGASFCAPNALLIQIRCVSDLLRRCSMGRFWMERRSRCVCSHAYSSAS